MDSGFVRMQTVQAAKEVVFFYNNGLFKQDFEINFAPGLLETCEVVLLLSRHIQLHFLIFRNK